MLNRTINKLLNKPFIGAILQKFVATKINSEIRKITQHFSQFLVPTLATNTELKDAVFNIRHQVYCEELRFEPVREDAKESDEFDPYSQFCMIQHLSSARYTGCVRLVCPTDEEHTLPIEKYCAHAISEEEFHPKQFLRSEICEISRLAVLSDFRRRNMDRYKGSAIGAINEETYSEEELRCFPFIAIGLYFSVGALALMTGKKHAFIMTEPRIARSLGRAGINFKQIGPVVDYHGKRAPYYINPKMLFANMSPGLQFLFESIQTDIINQNKLLRAGKN